MWRQDTIVVETQGRGFREITDEVASRVQKSGLRVGLCHLFLRHTSASLCVTENAAPEVRADLERFAQRLAPDGDPMFSHDEEGPDDMSAHVRNLFAGYELTIPIQGAKLRLGTWQGVFLWEHRARGHRREIVITLSGE